MSFRAASRGGSGRPVRVEAAEDNCARRPSSVFFEIAAALIVTAIA
jgi:hypothetical protein